ncbi:MAG: type II toxin-antitoxin system Phd/YefM family antitoxin [Nitrospirota bacterium]
MKTVSTEHAKQELGRLVQHSVKGHEAFRITHEAGDAVLLSSEDYETLIEAIEALSVSSQPSITPRVERPRR